MGITLWQYYLNVADKIVANAYSGIESREDWEKQRPVLYEVFMKSMLLDPLPDRDGLRMERHGCFSGDGYKAEKIAFEILPDCWSTGTIYYPDPMPAEKLPGVLYLCGHNTIGVYGYQRHPLMWARRGYACFILDTIEQHDSGGEHHGTYFRNQYDWISLGYTGGGGELWNSIRALDVFCELPGVDAERIGATGISGGGAQSFFLAIADTRIKAVASSCGITLPNYTLAHSNIQYHCDCMYYNNIFQKSTGEFAGLIAPRPALFCFGSKDALFSPPEYKLLTEQAKKAYGFYGCEDKCQLFDYDAPHMYVPESVKAINDWFDKYVAGEEHPEAVLGDVIENSDYEVTVYNGNPPAENKMHIIHELMASQGSIPLPKDTEDWQGIRIGAIEKLRKEVFYGMENLDEQMTVKTLAEWSNKGRGETNSRARQTNRYLGDIEGMSVRLKLDTMVENTEKILITLADATETARDVYSRMLGYVMPHGLLIMEGRTGGFNGTRKEMEWDFLRGGMQIGLSPVTIMVKDYLLALEFARSTSLAESSKFYLHGSGDAGVAAIYASLFDDSVAGVVAENIPAGHRESGYIPNIISVMDIDHAIGLVAPRRIGLVNQTPRRFHWSGRAFQRLGCAGNKLGTDSLKVAVSFVLAD
ncbi:MAG: hypothetical protein GX811_03470 [Lentisphaerae bacterium]|nr:hypothetical protein [Lentisphaerota bacterium]